MQTSEYFGNASPAAAPWICPPAQRALSGVNAAADTDFVIAAGNDKVHGARCALATGTPELVKDPRFLSARQIESTAIRPPSVDLCWSPFLPEESAADWLAEMDRRRVPCGPIDDFALT